MKTGYQIKQFDKKEKALVWPQLKAIAKDGDCSNINSGEVSQLFVAYKDKTPVAFSGPACYHGYWCLRICIVSCKHRGNGLQKKMIVQRLKWAKDRGAKWVNVWVSPSNIYSLNNILDCGFTKRPDKPKMFNGKLHNKYRILL